MVIKIFIFLKYFFIISVGIFAFTFSLLIRNTLLSRWHDNTLPSEYGMPFEEINFYSKDKIMLKGWLILNNKDSSTIILCHGLGTNKSELLSIAKFIYDAGFNIFLFDFRGHGESQGKVCSLGYFEQKDLEGAMDYLYQRFEHKNIGVFGLSLGGAVAIMVASKDERIKIVVSEGAYKELYSSMLYFAKVFYSLPKIPFNIFLRIAYFLRFGIDPQDVSPQKVITHISPRPVFIINGEKDKQIPPQNAYTLFERAHAPKEIWIIPQADHGEGYGLYPEVYSQKIINFLKKNI
ncbi:MAG: alpha/beta hydrolase [Candidatus Omnitrophica bacterium]|nr:alpha/beta hydrolase [Candidatus Omnitrophota bacterium]